MAYRGPTLITEPEIRWPLILVAAAITSVIVLVTAGVIHLAATRPYRGRVLEQRLEGAIRRETPGFDELSGLLVVEQLVAAEAPRPLNEQAVEITGIVSRERSRPPRISFVGRILVNGEDVSQAVQTVFIC